MKSNIRSEMKEMKERLETLTAASEENKDEGQLLTCKRDVQRFHTSVQFPERLRYQLNMCATFHSVIWELDRSSCWTSCQSV